MPTHIRLLFNPSPASLPIRAGHLCIVNSMQICNSTSNLHKDEGFFIFFLFLVTTCLIVQRSEEDRTKRGLITSSTLSEVSPNTMHSYTSKCPRRWRERHTITLECFFNFGEISESKNKANASFLYVFYLFYSISDYFKLMYLDFWHESRFLAVLACE